jgi:methionyl-tRNA formyltransferase
VLDDAEDTGGTITHEGQEYPAGPGSILAASDEQIDIALLGGVLHARRLQRDGGKKVGAGEFAREMGVEVGDGFEDGKPAD